MKWRFHQENSGSCVRCPTLHPEHRPYLWWGEVECGTGLVRVSDFVEYSYTGVPYLVTFTFNWAGVGGWGVCEGLESTGLKPSKYEFASDLALAIETY